MSVREFARVLGMSHATVSKWENARLVPDVEQVVAYLQAAGVTGEARERVLMLVRGSDDPSWLASGLPGASQGLAGVLECERMASDIVEWSPLLIPGLLQNESYAREILSSDETLSPKELDALVDLRVINRRRILTEVRDPDAGLGPVDYTALISEGALRTRVTDPAAHADQLRLLLDIGQVTGVSIQVVRPDQGWHPGLSGPFIVYSFADTAPIVHLEHHRSSAFLYEPTDIAAYKVAATVIRRRAMSPQDSAVFIADILNEVENE